MKILIEKKQFVLAMIVFLLAFSTKSFAADEDAISIPSVRSLNMGGAFTAVADDEGVLFYNPAGLAFLEGSRLTCFGLKAHFNEDTISSNSELISAYMDANPQGNQVKSEAISQTSINKLKKFDPLFNFVGPFQITYTRPNFAFSLLNLQTSAKMDFEYDYGKKVSNILLHGRSDTLGAIAYGRRVYRGLAVGLTLKYLVRGELGDSKKGAAIVDVLDQDETLLLKRGLGYDIGVIYDLERWGLKVGAALKDVLSTGLTVEERKLDGFDVEEDYTAEIKQSFAIGLSYQPDVKIPHKRFAYIPHNLILSADVGSDGLHLGTEMKVYRWLALRLGIHGGVQLGLGLRTKTLALDYMFTPSVEDPFLDEETDNNHYLSLLLSY